MKKVILTFGVCVALALLAPGTATAQFDVTGVFTIDGQLGVGTDSPVQRMELVNTTAGSSRFMMTNSEGEAGVQTDAGNMGFRTGNTGATVEVMTLHKNGKLGIGTKTPQQLLHLLTVSAGSSRFRLENAEGFADFIVNDNAVAISVDGATVFSVEGNGDADVSGAMTVEILEITGGSDLAEGFDVRSASEVEAVPGMVVSINPDDPGALMVSTEPYQRTVAGIISGAGGISTGMTMGQKGSVANGEYPVALTGRVYCKVDTSNGAIRPGDLLTTSSIPGHAMKVTDFGKAQGAIIGKAMTPLDSGTGMVLVLVTLQ